MARKIESSVYFEPAELRDIEANAADTEHSTSEYIRSQLEECSVDD